VSQPQTKPEILATLESNANAIDSFFSGQPDHVLFTGNSDHWGPAHHLHHLALTSQAVARGLRKSALPPHASGRSRGYGELIAAATNALQSAPKELQIERGRVVVIAPGTTRTGLVADFRSASADLRAATAAWIDDDLDLRALPHPYLGALTVREMLLFCVFHERNHLKRVRASLEPVT
jgi:NAD(P)-dependent dehydrogenase (short-subunit alcohol dehydrogenase family)